MVDLEILSPVANRLKEPEVKLAARLDDLKGKTIGLYWNNKPSGDLINQVTAESLAGKSKGIRFKNYKGSVGSLVRRLSDEDADLIAKECDAVVGSAAD